jgi:hypothetical protein
MNARASSVRFFLGEALLDASALTIFGLRIDPMRHQSRSFAFANGCPYAVQSAIRFKILGVVPNIAHVPLLPQDTPFVPKPKKPALRKIECLRVGIFY